MHQLYPIHNLLNPSIHCLATFTDTVLHFHHILCSTGIECNSADTICFFWSLWTIRSNIYAGFDDWSRSFWNCTTNRIDSFCVLCILERNLKWYLFCMFGGAYRNHPCHFLVFEKNDSERKCSSHSGGCKCRNA